MNLMVVQCFTQDFGPWEGVGQARDRVTSMRSAIRVHGRGPQGVDRWAEGSIISVSVHFFLKK